MYLLKISGYIPERKVLELRQSYQELFGKQPRECLGFSLSQDLINSTLFHFFSLWPDEESMEDFKKSSDFKMLIGSFKVLGFIDHCYSGEWYIDWKDFEKPKSFDHSEE